MANKNLLVFVGTLVLNLALLGWMCRLTSLPLIGPRAETPTAARTILQIATQTSSSSVTPLGSPFVEGTESIPTTPAAGFSPVGTGTLEFTSTLTSEVVIEPSATFGLGASGAWCVPLNSETIQAQVIQVIDAVSIEVEIEGETFVVRYIGIDLPDPTSDPLALAQAIDMNRSLVEGRTVLLIKDSSESDGSGQLLRYVIAGVVFVNREMVESGFAIAVSAPPNVNCDSIFQEAEALARASGRGLWAPAPTPTRTPLPPTPTLSTVGDVRIVTIDYTGTEWQEPEEFVEIRNFSSWPIQLQGWTISDNKRHIFTFPDFILGAGVYCRVYTNGYYPGVCNFSYNSLSPIWDDDSDCAYLKDNLGNLVFTFCYD